MGGRHVLIFGAESALVAYEVGVGAGKACGAHRLMGVDHDLVVGGAAYGVEIVAHGVLVIVVFRPWGGYCLHIRS